MFVCFVVSAMLNGGLRIDIRRPMYMHPMCTHSARWHQVVVYLTVRVCVCVCPGGYVSLCSGCTSPPTTPTPPLTAL